MKALTVKQPHAWAIAATAGDGKPLKSVENRGWLPKCIEKGDFFAIHAGAVKPPVEAVEMYRQVCEGPSVLARPAPVASEMARGAIIALARYGGWVGQDDPRLGLRSVFWFGPKGWLLEDVVRLDHPVPAKGALSLWEVEAKQLIAIRRLLLAQGLEGSEAFAQVSEAREKAIAEWRGRLRNA